jgi:uncharacterized protein RhaS with RHS repeats
VPGSTGVDDMRARDYYPATGEFTSVDPQLSNSGLAYAYAADDPTFATDPSGTITCPSWLPGCGVVTNIENNLKGIWDNVWEDNPCVNPHVGAMAAAVPSAYELALQVAEATGGEISAAKDGLKVLVPYGNRGIMVRVMEATDQYPNGYLRISVPARVHTQ